MNLQQEGPNNKLDDINPFTERRYLTTNAKEDESTGLFPASGHPRKSETSGPNDAGEIQEVSSSPFAFLQRAGGAAASIFKKSIKGAQSKIMPISGSNSSLEAAKRDIPGIVIDDLDEKRDVSLVENGSE